MAPDISQLFPQGLQSLQGKWEYKPGIKTELKIHSKARDIVRGLTFIGLSLVPAYFQYMSGDLN